EADEHRDDPEVHDVPAVAASTLGDETTESDPDGLVIVALRGCSMAGPYPSIKLLEDHGDVEAHQRYGRERQRLLQWVEDHRGRAGVEGREVDESWKAQAIAEREVRQGRDRCGAEWEGERALQRDIAGLAPAEQ